MPRFVLHGLVAIAAVGGFAVVADALVVSDEERLEQLADELTEAPPAERVEGVLRHIDPSREPLRLQHGGGVRHFDGEDGDRGLHEAVYAALEPFAAADLEVVQRAVDVDGDRATVAVRVRAGGALHDARLSLVRSGQGWVVSRLGAR